MQIQTKEQISIVCRELLKGGALSVGKLIEERAPPPVLEYYQLTLDELKKLSLVDRIAFHHAMEPMHQNPRTTTHQTGHHPSQATISNGQALP